MCSRYEINARPRDLADRFRLSPVPPLRETAEVRPTDETLVILAGNRPVLLSWGLPVLRDGKPLINARAETLTERPTFRPLLANRCLVPATAYFEWRHDGQLRLKNRIAPADGRPFAFAGLFTQGFFTIITCAPAPAIRHVHARMPVILDETREADWIDGAKRFDEVAPLLCPYGAQPLAAAEEQPRNPQLSLF